MQYQAIKSEIERIYGFAMPDSLFAFWDFFNRAEPALRDAIEIIAVGPFELLRGVTNKRGPIWRGRYVLDPPEFLTLLEGDSDGLHWGYFVDEPGQPDPPVAYYYHRDGSEMTLAGADIFEAVRFELECYYRSALDAVARDRANAGAQAQLEQQDALRNLLKQYATADRPEQGWAYFERYSSPQLRQPVAPTSSDNMGIVVPPETYRPLVQRQDGGFGLRDPEGGQSALEEPFQRRDYCPTAVEAEQMTDAALKAIDGGFPGTALKIGRELWAYRAFQDCSYRLLAAAYDALRRPVLRRYLEIAHAHRTWCEAGGPAKERAAAPPAE